jgi:hypothetical protein
MRKSRRIAAGVLAGILATGLLTGCGGSKGKIGSSVKLETGDIQENSIVMKVGDIGVKYSEIRSYCYLLKTQYEGNFGSELWAYPLDEGTTIGDEAKEEIINMITQLKIIGATAEAQKVTLTNDEKDEALQKAEQMLDAATEENRKEYHLSLQGLEKIYEENVLANKMFYIATDDADTEVSDEEAKQIKIAFLFVKKDSNDEDSAKKKADKLRKQAKKADEFIDFAKENTEANTVELTIGKDSTEIDAQAVTAALALEKGKISPVVAGEDGYYILYCVSEYDEDATYARKEQIIEQRQTSMFKEKYAKWLGDYDVDISKAFWKIFEI